MLVQPGATPFLARLPEPRTIRGSTQLNLAPTKCGEGQGEGAGGFPKIPRHSPLAAVVSAGGFGLSAGRDVRCGIPGAGQSQWGWGMLLVACCLLLVAC